MKELNLKPRLLWCESCKIDNINALPSPRCKLCGGVMLTVTFSQLTGKRITGAEDAGNRSQEVR